MEGREEKVGDRRERRQGVKGDQKKGTRKEERSRGTGQVK